MDMWPPGGRSSKALPLANPWTNLQRLEAISQIPAAAFEKQTKQQQDAKSPGNRSRTADLLAGHVVIPRLKPATGIRPASCLVASQNLWPRPSAPIYEMTSRISSSSERIFDHKSSLLFGFCSERVLCSNGQTAR